MSQEQPQGAVIGVLRAEASATVTHGPETLARIAAGELSPDGTPVSDGEAGAKRDAQPG